ncbi:MAG: hypothetical protein MIO93_02795, partial [ANME-2 cluster archaeon]|nr:hypothetical protein [ANME-2 cluster archaeon]
MMVIRMLLVVVNGYISSVVILRLRQMAPPLSIEIEISIWETAMTINPERKTEFKRVWIKTAEHQLFHELET